MPAIRIWDLPTRLFHWSLVMCVVGLVISANIGGNAMTWHFRLGYAVLTLLLFRVVWGLVGGRWSRFTSFLYSPTTLFIYLRGRGQLEHGVGHSPTGALSVFALLALLLMQVGSGLISDDEIAFAGPLVSLVASKTSALATSYHKDIGKWLIMALIALHLVAILFYKFVKKTDLVAPMLHGDKELPPSIQHSKDTLGIRLGALLVLTCCAVAVERLVAWGGSGGF